jgi:hypothetical protein
MLYFGLIIMVYTYLNKSIKQLSELLEIKFE